MDLIERDVVAGVEWRVYELTTTEIAVQARKERRRRLWGMIRAKLRWWAWCCLLID